MEADLGRYSHGVWTTDHARRLGVTAGRQRQLLAEGSWHTVHRGVYTDAGIDLDAVQRSWAAVLAAGAGAVAVRRTAARVWRLPLIDDDDPATGRHEHVHDDVAVPRAIRERDVLHPVRLHLRRDERRGVGGCPVTTALRTLWDLTSVLRPDALVCALDDALHRQLVQESELLAEAGRRAGSPGVAAFRTAVALADRRAESPLETLTRLVLVPHLPLVPQVPVRAPGLVARIDLGDPQVRFGVEADGRAAHTGELVVRRDRERERRLAAYGWVLERCGWHEVRCRPDALRERVQRAWQAQTVARR